MIVGLDIGSTKVCALVGGLTDADQVEVIGVGLAPSVGLRKGTIIDAAGTADAIRAAVDEARSTAQTGLEGAHVYVGVTGDHLESLNSVGAVDIERPNDQIQPADVDRVRAAAAAATQAADREVLLERPREFVIDGRGGVTDPVGCTGRRLELALHVVTGQRQFLDQVRDVVEKAGLPVDGLVVEAVATGEAVTSVADRQQGCLVLDIGGGTSDVAVYLDGTLAHTAAIPVGGAHLSFDLSYGLETPYPTAEALKIEHGCALVELCDPQRQVTYQRADGDEATVPQTYLAEICQPRNEELLELILANLGPVGLVPRQLQGGVILTGGASRLAGLPTLVRRQWQAAVREGQPLGVTGLAARVAGPQFSTAVGLVRFGAGDQTEEAGPASDASLASRLKGLYRYLMSQFD